jgi:NAD-dependent deacetylase
VTPAVRTASREAARLAELLNDADAAVVLTGAGVSVPSGIPDFRTPGEGLWEKVNPMEVAHIDAFRRDPDRFWSFYSQRFMGLRDKQPNEAHRVLADLERRGLVRALVTQNIDRLHTAAGSTQVIEVHGSIERCICMECGGYFALEQVVEMLERGVGTPECTACIAPLKPDVVLFGEMLPEEAMAEAYALAREADLILCVGTSLEVYPVAGLPRVTLDAGGAVALITQGPTPYDAEADVKLDGDVVDELTTVRQLLVASS